MLLEPGVELVFTYAQGVRCDADRGELTGADAA